MERLRPHLPAIITFILMAAMAIAAMNSQNNLLFWGVGVIAAALLISIVLAHMAMRSLVVRRLDPKHGVVGEPMVVHYAITNRSRFLPVFNVMIEEIPGRGDANWDRFVDPTSAWVLHIAPRQTVHGEAVFWPQARGEMRFSGLRMRTTFPFGMVHRSRKLRQASHTLIFPRLFHLKRGVLDAIIPSGPLGMKLSNRPGGGDDYFGLREYRPGDSRRAIAWKRSAGTDQLIIKERTLSSPPRMRIVLNLGTPTAELRSSGGNGVNPRQLEERAISLAATMIESSARNGYEVGLAVIGFDLPVTPLRSNYWHIEKVMGELAAIDLDRDRVRSVENPIMEGERAGIAVVHPGRIDPTVVRSASWHFSATQMLHLVERRRRDEPPIFASASPLSPTADEHGPDPLLESPSRAARPQKRTQSFMEEAMAS